MKKSRLIFLSTFFLFLLFSVGGSFLFYLSFDVAKLSDHYIVFDKKEKNYKLDSRRPKNWVSLYDVSKLARWAIIVSEDWAFYQHIGLDFQQLEVVIEESLVQKKLVRGASTITQQVVKNAFLSNERSLWRKYKEFILAIKLEKSLPKNKILEHYLNLVELGDGIYGIRAAAKYYFEKEPRDLTAREGAFLAMLLPSPIKYGSSFREKKLTPFARKVIGQILIKLRQARVYTEEDRLMAMHTRFSWEEFSEEDNFDEGFEEELDQVIEDDIHYMNDSL